MVLPLYVSLEKIDRRLIEAAQDLYAGPWRRGGALIGGIAGAVLAVGVMAGLSYLPLAPHHLLEHRSASPLIGAVVGAAIATPAHLRVVRPGHLPAQPVGRLRGLDPDVHPGASATTSTPSCWATRRPR